MRPTLCCCREKWSDRLCPAHTAHRPTDQAAPKEALELTPSARGGGVNLLLWDWHPPPQRGAGVRFTGCGSIIGLHTVTRDIRIPADAEEPVPDKKPLIHLEMMLRGITYAQRGYMTLNLAMTEGDLDHYASAFDEVLAAHADLLA